MMREWRVSNREWSVVMREYRVSKGGSEQKGVEWCDEGIQSEQGGE